MRTFALKKAIDAPQNTLDLGESGSISYYHTEDSQDSRSADPPLLLLHSINAVPSAMEVKPLFDAYRDKRAVYAPDLPGFGMSERKDRAYDADFFSRFIDQFIRSVIGADHQEPCDIVAMSTTAEFVARAILEWQTPCRSVSFISPTGLTTRKMPGQSSGDKITRVLRLPLLGSGLFRTLTTRPSVRYFLGLSFDGDVPTELVDYAVMTAKHPNARLAPFSFVSGKLFHPNAAEALYAKLTLPVQVLYDKDPNISFEKLPAHAAQHPNWRLSRIDGSNGLPHWTHTAETIDALDEFWASIQTKA